MMGPRQVEQGALFYNFCLDAHVPADHLVRSIDRFLDLSDLRRELAPFYSSDLPERTWLNHPVMSQRCHYQL